MIMDSRIRHVPSGQIYNNRKEAKKALGHSFYNKAVHSKEIELLNPDN